MRKVISASVSAFVVVICVGLAMSGGVPPQASTALEGSLLRSYSSVTELAQASELIVVGTVIATDARPFVNMPFSVARVQISEIVKGEGRRTVNVLQTGGLFPRSSKTSSPTEGVFGQRVARQGERYILFLYRYEGPVADDAYMALGEFQGRFLLDRTNRVSFNGNVDNLASPQYEVLRAVQGRSASEVLAEVRSTR